MNYSYRAKLENGQEKSGVIDARSSREAMRQLQIERLTVLELRETSEPVDKQAVMLKFAAQTVKREDVIAFSSQLSVMLETGVPLPDALHAFVEQSRGGSMKPIVETINARVTNGVSFSAAIGEFPTVFPVLMRTLMKASEASGKMGLMLARISEYLTKERRTARQIKGALTYPAVMITLALTVTMFLVTWVLPRFAKIYQSRKAALPKPTEIVLGIGEFVTMNWPYLIGGAAALIAAFFAARMHPVGRRAFDTFKLRAPIIGPMFTACYLARGCRTLGTLLASGVSMLEAVRLVRELVPNVLWADLWRKVEESLTQGRTIAEVVCASKLVPPAVGQMIAAGERTGRLSEVLDRVSVSAESDLDESVKTATQLIEPAMILFMGATIGGIAIALLLPIFTIANVVAK